MKRMESVFLFALLVLMASALVSEATLQIATDWKATYPSACGKLRDAADFCSLCHDNDFSLSPYAADYLAAGRSWTAIEGLDSDSDRAVNLAEIGACTLPGDPNSGAPIDAASWSHIKSLYR